MRAWRTRDGALAARKGGTPPGVQARGATVAELTAAIAGAGPVGQPPGPGPRSANYRAVLAAIDGADRPPLTARAIAGKSGLALSTAVYALGILCAQGVTERRRDGHLWLYQRAAAGPVPAEPPAGD